MSAPEKVEGVNGEIRVWYVEPWTSRFYDKPQGDFWGAHLKGHTYRGRSREEVIAKADGDPRNDDHSLLRSSQELTEVRTVLSRAQTAIAGLERMGPHHRDLDHDSILFDLRMCVSHLEGWARP